MPRIGSYRQILHLHVYDAVAYEDHATAVFEVVVNRTAACLGASPRWARPTTWPISPVMQPCATSWWPSRARSRSCATAGWMLVDADERLAGAKLADLSDFARGMGRDVTLCAGSYEDCDRASFGLVAGCRQGGRETRLWLLTYTLVILADVADSPSATRSRPPIEELRWVLERCPEQQDFKRESLSWEWRFFKQLEELNLE